MAGLTANKPISEIFHASCPTGGGGYHGAPVEEGPGAKAGEGGGWNDGFPRFPCSFSGLEAVVRQL